MKMRASTSFMKKSVSIPGVGLKRFMAKVYTNMGLGVAASIGTSLAFSPFISEATVLPTFVVGAIGSFGSIYVFSKYKPTYHSTLVGDEPVYYTKNPKWREWSFWGLSASMGLTMSPLVHIIMKSDPFVVPASILISSYIFGSCALYSYRTANTQILQWKAPLMIGLGGLVGMQFAGLVVSMFMGPNSFSSIVHNVDVYGGIGLFTLMSIYDSYIAKQMYIRGDPDHLSCTLTLYLDFMNLLIRVMEALAKARKD